MQRRPINQTAPACVRYNLFRAKLHPDLCWAVPEDQPVPGFITGEICDFGGTWGGVLPLPGTAPVGELGLGLHGFHPLRIAGPSERLTWPSTPRVAALSAPKRGKELEWQPDSERSDAPAA
jgi:hypothetical protein